MDIDFSDFILFLDKFKNQINKPILDQHAWLFENYNTDQITDIINKIKILYNLILIKFLEYNLADLKILYQKYNIFYKSDNYHNFCLKYNEVSEPHDNLIHKIILYNSDILFKFLTTDYKILLKTNYTKSKSLFNYMEIYSRYLIQNQNYPGIIFEYNKKIYINGKLFSGQQ